MFVRPIFAVGWTNFRSEKPGTPDQYAPKLPPNVSTSDIALIWEARGVEVRDMDPKVANDMLKVIFGDRGSGIGEAECPR